ncbi:MAG: hypothetical protein AB1714_04730 [Acidobacteriota bacterium]
MVGGHGDSGRASVSRWKSIEEVLLAKSVTAKILSLFPIALPTVFAVPRGEGFSDINVILGAFVATAPLTVAVAVAGVMLVRDADARGNPAFDPLLIPWMLFALGIVTLVSTLVASWLGVGAGITVSEIWRRAGGGATAILGFPIAVVEYYYEWYGLRALLSSFVAGAFLAWLWTSKLLPAKTDQE